MREFLEIMLGKEGYKVKTVSNGNDALQAIQNETFDLAIVDIQMPGLSGIDVLKKTKK